MKSVKEKKTSILIIEEKDLTEFSDCIKGTSYDYIFVPKSIKESFLLSDLRLALVTSFKDLKNNFSYYE